jgi:hypothetical protein
MGRFHKWRREYQKGVWGDTPVIEIDWTLADMELCWQAATAEQRKPQPCGHPTACITSSDEGTSYCAWCEDVARLREAAKPFANLGRVMNEGNVLNFRGVYVTYNQVQELVAAIREENPNE